MTDVAQVADMAKRMHEYVDLTDMDAIEKFNGTGFNLIGENYYSVRPVPPAWLAQVAEDVLEIGPKGIVSCPTETIMQVTFGGTPHHVRHQFGYWHINDVDEVMLWQYGKTPEDQATVFLMMRAPRPGERDMFAWYCEKCLNLLYCSVYDSGNKVDDGWDGVMAAERVAIDIFNNDQDLRICKECGAEHPLGYSSDWDLDAAPEEVEARWAW